MSSSVPSLGDAPDEVQRYVRKQLAEGNHPAVKVRITSVRNGSWGYDYVRTRTGVGPPKGPDGRPTEPEALIWLPQRHLRGWSPEQELPPVARASLSRQVARFVNRDVGRSLDEAKRLAPAQGVAAAFFALAVAPVSAVVAVAGLTQASPSAFAFFATVAAGAGAAAVAMSRSARKFSRAEANRELLALDVAVSKTGDPAAVKEAVRAETPRFFRNGWTGLIGLRPVPSIGKASARVEETAARLGLSMVPPVPAPRAETPADTSGVTTTLEKPTGRFRSRLRPLLRRGSGTSGRAEPQRRQGPRRPGPTSGPGRAPV